MLGNHHITKAIQRAVDNALASHPGGNIAHIELKPDMYYKAETREYLPAYAVVVRIDNYPIAQHYLYTEADL